jgi:hypothetical protein
MSIVWLLSWERAYRTVAYQWTSALAPLFRRSGVMSQYSQFRGLDLLLTRI